VIEPAGTDSGGRPLMGALQWVALLALVAVLVILRLDSVTGGSIDLAHHYVLAFRLAEDWSVVSGDPTMGEMSVYPRLSHAMAAVAGTVLHSTFLGMHLVALLALALLWAAVLHLYNSLTLRAALAASLALGALALLNQQFFGVQLHGAELIGNYFYAQLVGQGLALAVLALAVSLEARFGALYAWALLAAAIFVMTSLHLLPALELFGALAGVLLVDTLLGGRSGRARIGLGLGALALLLASAASVYLNPDFKAMRSISENNGELILAGLPTLGHLAALCLLVLLCAAAVLYLWARPAPAQRAPALKYLAVYGGAMAALCLLQMALLNYGMGSEYAVKKYGFGLMTICFVLVAAALGLGVERVLRARAALPVAAAPLRLVTAGAVLALLFLTSSGAPKVLDTSEVVAMEQQVLAVRRDALPLPAAGLHHAVVDVREKSQLLSYMFSIAILGTPRYLIGTDLLVHNRIQDFSKYDRIVGARRHSRYARAACDSSMPGPMLVQQASCLAGASELARVCKGTLDFSVKGELEASMMTGMGDAEQSSRWTAGRRATITCSAEGAPRRASLTLTPFLVATLARQRLLVSINGNKAAALVFDQPGVARTIVLDLPKLADGVPLTLTLETPDATSPKALGLSGDSRELAFALTTLSFE
jgi:hypothetical protein